MTKVYPKMVPRIRTGDWKESHRNICSSISTVTGHGFFNKILKVNGNPCTGRLWTLHKWERREWAIKVSFYMTKVSSFIYWNKHFSTFCSFFSWLICSFSWTHFSHVFLWKCIINYVNLLTINFKTCNNIFCQRGWVVFAFFHINILDFWFM